MVSEFISINLLVKKKKNPRHYKVVAPLTVPPTQIPSGYQRYQLSRTPG